MEIKFRPINPVPPLKRYIERIWVFESNRPMPEDDMKLVVPNGRLLLIIPFRNGLTGKKDNKHYLAPENKIALVGMSDKPSIVDAQTDGPTGIIGVEINPLGAYRFFHIPLRHITNELHHLSDILGKTFLAIENRITESQSINDKITLLQQFLFSHFIQREDDALFNHCIKQIEITKGGVSIRDLERTTGYTSRWLNMKFEERLGISPKNFSSIIRFQHYYQILLSDASQFFRQKDFYRHYHDESHFIREFKRFTGMPPLKLMDSKNEFGTTFYQED